MTNTSEELYSSVSPLTIDGTKNLKGPYKIKKGDRIAQIVLHQVPTINLKQVDSVIDIGNSRGGGFGSTGVR
jgi:dUTP pyrophosphatase